MFREGELAKLPKWAQDKVTALQGELDSYKEVLQTMRGGTSNVEVVLPGHGLPSVFIPSRSMVSFKDAENHSIQVYYREKEGLIVRGETSIIVKPMAANSLYIKLGD